MRDRINCERVKDNLGCDDGDIVFSILKKTLSEGAMELG